MSSIFLTPPPQKKIAINQMKNIYEIHLIEKYNNHVYNIVPHLRL